MGADLLVDIGEAKWKNSKELVQENKFIVMARNGIDMLATIAKAPILRNADDDQTFHLMDKGLAMEISSTYIRDEFQKNGETGLFTRFGDGGADILPLADLTKGQGRELLKELGAPEQLYLKTPTADLLDNKPQQSDETELGIEYNVLDQYLVGNKVDSDIEVNIEKRFEVTKHKRKLPVTPFDTWWKWALSIGKVCVKKVHT